MATASASQGNVLMSLFIQELIRRMQVEQEKEGSEGLPPAFLEVVRKFLGDNSITLASVQRGDFGELARSVAEEFPFTEETANTYQ